MRCTAMRFLVAIHERSSDQQCTILGRYSLAWGVIPQTWVVTLPWCSFNSWRIFVVCCAIPSLMGGIIVYLCLPESPKFLMNQGKKEEALNILRHVFVVNTGKDPGDYMMYKIQRDLLTFFSKQRKKNCPNVIESSSEMAEDSGNKPVDITFCESSWVDSLANSSNKPTPLICSPCLDPDNQIALRGHSDSGPIAAEDSPYVGKNEGNFRALLRFEIESGDETLKNHLGNCAVDETLYQYFPGNRSIWNYESNSFTNNSSLIDDIILNNPSYGNQTEIAECDSTITPETFRNTLIIGGGTGAINLIIGFVVRWTGRKVIGFVFMGVAAGSCIGLDFGQTSEIVLVLAFLFVCLTGVSSSLLNSAVVDIFPTQLR
ncbi:unnamed protein product [Timema podura]|uniref:Major facilitator superfamily (MFS) profile domain-containing protein n=1 Tax=Timema podura TaxID=61482 RepID=A0ABN7P740_TIMPD|nr:unnamed protein product [Timema podura]